MLKLNARGTKRQDAEPFIVRVTRNPAGRSPLPEREAFMIEPGAIPPTGYRAYLALKDDGRIPDGEADIWPTPEPLAYLSDGDIIRINPRSGEFWVMYRRNSAFNAVLLTEQCNSNCIMCSQPPKVGDDSHLLRAYQEAIPLMSPDSAELCITGGEPTLLGDALLDVIRLCKECLPDTSLHMLSNGRMCNYLSLCRDIAAIGHPDLMIGIPLYSDIADRHDFVVQADGAFDQTVRGIMNLARCKVPVEIRMVLHRDTVDRLPQFARFIARNLPFVRHVALMGLEMMGYVKMNLDSLWVDPLDYQLQLFAAVDTLLQHGMNTSIYNHQLCVLDRRLWPVARQSISDWKNEYISECGRCSVRERCGGFFTSSTVRRSSHIHAIADNEALLDVENFSLTHDER